MKVAMNLEEQNIQVLNLMQSLVGCVSPNFRSVKVDFDGTGGVILRFILEQDIAEDREEIEEIVFQFEAYQSSLVKVEVEVLVDDRPIHVVNPTVKGRAVYGRRELV
jgi:hypothetical protein